MCIRDRGYLNNFLGSPGIITLTVDHNAARGHVDIAGVAAPCLLYTSDAADERSSVDLGGRRILKKKNTTATRECM